ncbi:MAG: polar amino acid transport system permease protein [Polaromonas sp.]|jgi:polar amino acid transport system permease protein
MSGLQAVWEARDLFLTGAWMTLTLVALCLVLSVPLAMLAHMVCAEGPSAISNALRLSADGLRCVPFLLLAYLVYYGLPTFGLRLDSYTAGLATLVLYNAAYFLEIFRSQSFVIPPETREAAEAFGFSRRKLYQRILFPQLLRTSLPMLGNQAVMVMKDSALLMIITVEELTFAANFVSANNFKPFAPFVMAVIIYWLYSLLIDAAVRRLQRRSMR